MLEFIANWAPLILTDTTFMILLKIVLSKLQKIDFTSTVKKNTATVNEYAAKLETTTDEIKKELSDAVLRVERASAEAQAAAERRVDNLKNDLEKAMGYIDRLARENVALRAALRKKVQNSDEENKESKDRP